MNDDIMLKTMVIYKITNNLNGKAYIGQTMQMLKNRMRRHLMGDLYIDLALKKYGIENFTVEVIEECKSVDELNEREIYYIAFFNTLYPNGYNMTEGGSNGIPSEATRQKQSESHIKAYQNPEILKRHSEGQKRRFEREEERQKVVDFMTGREMPLETREKISNTLIEFNADPEERKRKSERAKASHARPEVKARISERTAIALADPEVKERQKEGLRRANADPEVKKRRSEAQKRRQARERAEREKQKNNVELTLDFEQEKKE